MKSEGLRYSRTFLDTNILLNTEWFQPELDLANANPDRQIYPVISPGLDPGTSDLTLKVKDRLEQLTIEIAARAGEGGKLFGSVTNIDIERALSGHGITVERRRIILAEPIKELGEFVVPVRVDADVEASLKLKVAAE